MTDRYPQIARMMHLCTTMLWNRYADHPALISPGSGSFRLRLPLSSEVKVSCRSATIGGAQTLGPDQDGGSIEAGKVAVLTCPIDRLDDIHKCPFGT